MPQILLAEDDLDIRETLVFLLEGEGYQTRQASNLEEALTLLDSASFDLVMTDLLAHDRNQLLASALTLREHAAPTPVAILTAWRAVVQSPDTAGFAFVISKPFDLDVLLTAIAAAVQRPLNLEEEQRAQVVQQYFAALSAANWDALVCLCTEDVTYVLPGNGSLSVTVEGKVAFRAYAESVFASFPAARFEQINVYATPTGMAARYHTRWLGEDHASQQFAGAVVFQFAGLQIQRIGIRLNTERLRRLMEPPPPYENNRVIEE